MKREFVQLAQTLNIKKHRISAMLMSEKLDGMRAIWDGGASRGVPAAEVPWANTDKDGRFKKEQIATGLWSRYGHALHAPDWFLDHLPEGHILDGELWAGPGRFQEVTSVVRSLDKDSEWGNIDYMVLDLIDPEIIFEPGLISNINFTKVITTDCFSFWADKFPVHGDVPKRFETRYKALLAIVGMRPCVTVHPQHLTPLNTEAAEAAINVFLEYVLQISGEGIILRNPDTQWQTSRTRDVLKHKPHHDAEGTVIGYTWGRETDKGSKLLGKMGALMLRYAGHDFKLSGFTDVEREMTWIDTGLSADCIGKDAPGEETGAGVHNPMFPVGSQVTFKYRELSDDGIPKEARYWRKA